MMTLRCTRRLLKELRAPAPFSSMQPSTVLGDWYAGLYDATPQPVILCLSERSLLAVLLVFRDAGSLLARFPQAVTGLLERIGIPEEAIDAEREAMSGITIGKTANRRLLGCLNEAAFGLSTELDSMYEQYLGDHELFMSSFIYSTTQYRSPHALAQELFQAARSGSRPGLARIH
jgi:hypothetical protein